MSRDPYNLLNARLGLGSNAWNVALWGRNLADRKYLQEKGPDAFVVPANGACLAPGFVRQADSGN